MSPFLAMLKARLTPRLKSRTAGRNKYTPHQGEREKERRRIGGFHTLRGKKDEGSVR